MVTDRLLPAVGSAAVVPHMLPVEIGPAQARELARRELAEPIYHRDDPSLAQRVVAWALDQLSRLSERAVELVPAGWPGLIAIVALLIVVIVAIRLRLGPMGRPHAARSAIFGAHVLSPSEHRAAAERAATRGQWAEAIRERLRAIAGDLEQRVVIEPRPGRTADELAAEVGQAIPGCAAELRAAARIFDDVWYGARPATRESYERIVRLDEELRKAKHIITDPPAAAGEHVESAVIAGDRP